MLQHFGIKKSKYIHNGYICKNFIQLIQICPIFSINTLRENIKNIIIDLIYVCK